VLSAYWQNYVLDPIRRMPSRSSHRAARRPLRPERTLEDVDVVAVAEDALRHATEILEADCPVDLI